MTSIHFFKLQLLIYIIVGCSEPAEMEMDVPIPGKLVFVEDFDGRHGVLAGRFGDLVLIDGNENKRYALTDDHYYYAYPNLVNDGKEVWFESKRGDDLWPAGLGSRSDIYSLDIETGNIRNIKDSLSAFFETTLEHSLSRLSVSLSEKKLVFTMIDREVSTELPYNSIFYGDKNEGSLLKVETKIITLPLHHFFWSPDESRINYDRMRRHSRVYTYDFENQKNQQISNEFIETSLTSVFCLSGSWYDNDRFVYVCRNHDPNRNRIFMYNFESDSSTQLAEIVKDNFSIYSLHISQDGNYLVFIGKTMENYKILKSAIYVYDLETEEMKAFAENKREKRWLRWYEDL